MNSPATERRIFVVNSRAIAREVPITSTRRGWLAWLPAMWCANCDANIPQDIAQPPTHCPQCGAALVIF